MLRQFVLFSTYLVSPSANLVLQCVCALKLLTHPGLNLGQTCVTHLGKNLGLNLTQILFWTNLVLQCVCTLNLFTIHK